MDFKKIRAFCLKLFCILSIISSNCFSAPLVVGVGVSGLPIAQKIYSVKGPYYFGFCIDLMNDICKAIGESCTYKDTTLDNQFELLDQGKVDLLILSSPYTPYELSEYAASVPYAVSKMQFMALQNSPLNHLSDIKNKKIGALKNTFYSLLVESPYGSKNEIIAYNTNDELISDLTQHKVDLIAMNNVVAYTLMYNSTYSIKPVGHSIPLGEGYGIIGLPNKKALIEKINRAILSIENDGTYASIYRKYYIPED
ncbi:glutamine ABC transporter [Legionella birminghamensis]|uniref:Glutamine ABC transporter n=1 Tax=Legionella birminghamensis TaxID=28083 RepID=A0A378IF55_9GAMM|nr:transporter substrate-binding domain-containing protein [Legionella birminghamensis]KTC71528.1 glutamine ABC transporter [Legionella birminghamensis]STX30864.1 glutamine ABC transporter [Legionella birminghamensis]